MTRDRTVSDGNGNKHRSVQQQERVSPAGFCRKKARSALPERPRLPGSAAICCMKDRDKILVAAPASDAHTATAAAAEWEKRVDAGLTYKGSNCSAIANASTSSPVLLPGTGEAATAKADITFCIELSGDPELEAELLEFEYNEEQQQGVSDGATAADAAQSAAAGAEAAERLERLSTDSLRQGREETFPVAGLARRARKRTRGNAATAELLQQQAAAWGRKCNSASVGAAYLLLQERLQQRLLALGAARRLKPSGAAHRRAQPQQQHSEEYGAIAGGCSENVVVECDDDVVEIVAPVPAIATVAAGVDTGEATPASAAEEHKTTATSIGGAAAGAAAAVDARCEEEEADEEAEGKDSEEDCRRGNGGGTDEDEEDFIMEHSNPEFRETKVSAYSVVGEEEEDDSDKDSTLVLNTEVLYELVREEQKKSQRIFQGGWTHCIRGTRPPGRARRYFFSTEAEQLPAGAAAAVDAADSADNAAAEDADGLLASDVGVAAADAGTVVTDVAAVETENILTNGFIKQPQADVSISTRCSASCPDSNGSDANTDSNVALSFSDRAAASAYSSTTAVTTTAAVVENEGESALRRRNDASSLHLNAIVAGDSCGEVREFEDSSPSNAAAAAAARPGEKQTALSLEAAPSKNAAVGRQTMTAAAAHPEDASAASSDTAVAAAGSTLHTPRDFVMESNLEKVGAALMPAYSKLVQTAGFRKTSPPLSGSLGHCTSLAGNSVATPEGRAAAANLAASCSASVTTAASATAATAVEPLQHRPAGDEAADLTATAAAPALPTISPIGAADQRRRPAATVAVSAVTAAAVARWGVKILPEEESDYAAEKSEEGSASSASAATAVDSVVFSDDEQSGEEGEGAVFDVDSAVERKSKKYAFSVADLRAHHRFALACHQACKTVCFFCGKITCARSKDGRIPCPTYRCEHCYEIGHWSCSRAEAAKSKVFQLVHKRFQMRYYNSDRLTERKRGDTGACIPMISEDVFCICCSMRGHFVCGTPPAIEGFASLPMRTCVDPRQMEAKQNVDASFYWSEEAASAYYSQLQEHVRREIEQRLSSCSAAAAAAATTARPPPPPPPPPTHAFGGINETMCYASLSGNFGVDASADAADTRLRLPPPFLARKFGEYIPPVILPMHRGPPLHMPLPMFFPAVVSPAAGTAFPSAAADHSAGAAHAQHLAPGHQPHGHYSLSHSKQKQPQQQLLGHRHVQHQHGTQSRHIHTVVEKEKNLRRDHTVQRSRLYENFRESDTSYNVPLQQQQPLLPQERLSCHSSYDRKDLAYEKQSPPHGHHATTNITRGRLTFENDRHNNLNTLRSSHKHNVGSAASHEYPSESTSPDTTLHPNTSAGAHGPHSYAAADANRRRDVFVLSKGVHPEFTDSQQQITWSSPAHKQITQSAASLRHHIKYYEPIAARKQHDEFKVSDSYSAFPERRTLDSTAAIAAPWRQRQPQHQQSSSRGHSTSTLYSDREIAERQPTVMQIPSQSHPVSAATVPVSPWRASRANHSAAIAPPAYQVCAFASSDTAATSRPPASAPQGPFYNNQNSHFCYGTQRGSGPY